MACGCGKTTNPYSGGCCRSTSSEGCVKNSGKCCKKTKQCKPINGLCTSKFQTEAAERIALRRYSDLCCPIEPCYTACKGAVCPRTKKLGKIVCPDKQTVPKLKCGSCSPCRKNCL